MDLSLLKKKLSTYRTAKGRITRVSDELAYEILLAWEDWSGPASKFYAALGADHRKMASLIGRAKKLKREGVIPESQFKEIQLETNEAQTTPQSNGGITLALGQGSAIQFSQVDQLLEFLKKVS